MFWTVQALISVGLITPGFTWLAWKGGRFSTRAFDKAIEAKDEMAAFGASSWSCLCALLAITAGGLCAEAIYL